MHEWESFNLILLCHGSSPVLLLIRPQPGPKIPYDLVLHRMTRLSHGRLETRVAPQRHFGRARSLL
jgi:hypothetical protein